MSVKDYNLQKVSELKDLIADKEDFTNVMGMSLSSARKPKLVEYLQRKDGILPQTPTLAKSPSEPDLSKYLTNKSYDPSPPKLDKNFIPDPIKLEKIRESLPEQPTPPQPQLDPTLTEGLDEDDVHKLGNLLNSEVVESVDYVYEELCEVQCKKYAALYSNLKPILASPEFKSSREKLQYVESYLNSTRMNANLTNYLFMATTFVERNESVNKFIKLKGYTAQLNNRRKELEMYIEELKIKYMDEVGQYLSMPVEARLALIFAESAITVHLENKTNDLKKELSQKKN